MPRVANRRVDEIIWPAAEKSRKMDGLLTIYGLLNSVGLSNWQDKLLLSRKLTHDNTLDYHGKVTLRVLSPRLGRS
jgi:hypothetical protein